MSETGQRVEIEPVSQTIALSTRTLTPDIWSMISNMAPVMFRSRLFGVTSQEAAAAIMLKGYELGLSITASFEFVQVVQGKPGLSPRGALALLHNDPEIEKIEIKRLVDENDGFLGYECRMKRKNGFDHSERFTMEDARRAGIIKPGGGWETYPENMCKWRAIGFCADVVAPDIVAGMTTMMKMPEQLGVDLDDVGNVIDMNPAPAVEESQPVETVVVNPATPTVNLDELLERYGAEAIIVANEGRIPGTDEEVAAVAAKLEGNH